MSQEYISYKKALNKAMYFCSKAEKCKSDISKKLYDWKAKPDEHEKIISELEKQKFIDEKRYANFYVKDKIKFNNWGKIKIKTMLFQKQIPEKIIAEAISEIKQEEYLEMLKNVIKEKREKLKEKDPYKEKTKLLRFASSRGFEPNIIIKLLENEKKH
ncbi:MAG: RecX family transcriptional regulator [Bacteroidales bacterium]|nr:RecX family transcriptional regulator [Bacteroidales bacterium]